MTTPRDKKVDVTSDHKERTNNKIDSFFIKDSYVIWEFPSEFKRDWLKLLDFRFITILFLTAVAEICLIIFFMGVVKKSGKEIDVKKVQMRYAQLLLREFDGKKITKEKEEDAPAEDLKAEINLLTSISEQNILAENTQQEVELPLAAEVVNTPVTPDLSARKERHRKLKADSRDRFANELDREVSEKGLLHYIISSKGKMSNDELKNIFTRGDLNAKYLSSSTGKIKLASYQTIASAKDNFLDIFDNLKQTKSGASFSDELALLTPLEKVELENMAKHEEFDYAGMGELTKPARSKATRTAEHVTKVLASHNRAIQDCYKQAIRKEPNLKGKVVVRISVNPQGSVEQVQILHSTIDNERMLRCIVSRIRRWRDFGETDPALGVVSYRQAYVFGF